MYEIRFGRTLVTFAIFLFFTQGFGEDRSFSLSSASSVFRSISGSNTQFQINRSDDGRISEIKLNIDLYRDSEAQRSFSVFLSEGAKTTNNERFNIGAEWSAPVFFSANTTRNGEIGYEAAALSLGFRAKNTNEDFPFLFAAGPAFEGGFNRNAGQRDTIFGAGAYVRLSAGKTEDSSASRILNSPFLFGGQLFGRYLQAQNNHHNTNAQATFIYEINGFLNADSFSVTVSETLGYGKISPQFNSVGNFRGNEIPSMFSNNFGITLRAIEIGEAFLRPSFEIFLNDNRNRYISSQFFYGSLRKNTVSVLGFLNREFGGWDFETGLRISATREENSYFSSSRRPSQGTLLDTLNEKLKDADVFNPRLYFSSEFLSPNERFGLNMQYWVERNRRIYPFSFEREGEFFYSIDDFDNISNLSFVQTAFYFSDWYNLFLSAELLRLRINFLNSAMSIANRTEDRFALSVENVFSRDSSMVLGLRANAVAAPQRYFFAQRQGEYSQHNRSFSLSSDLTLFYENGWSNVFEFMTSRFDRGVIHNERYYGIEGKNFETISSATLVKNARFFAASGGIEAKIMNAYNFNHEENGYLSGGRRVSFSPFVSTNFFSKNKFSLNFDAKRNINRGQNDPMDFWELTLNIFAFF